MSTSDVRNSKLALSDRLEADLIELLRIEPSLGVIERLDDRIDRALRGWAPRAPRRSRLRPGRRAWVIGLLAAAFMVAGANGRLQALYFMFAGPFDVPWHRGVELDLSQVVDGYRVTIDRAYADATRLGLAMSVVDELKRDETTQVAAMSAIVTDGTGEYSSGGGGASIPDGPFAAVNVAWKQPPVLPLPAGPRQLHVVLPFIMVRDDSTPPPDADTIGWSPWRRQPGPWTFDFALDVDGGTTITPNVVSEIDGVRVSVTRVIVASSIVRVELRVDGDLPTGDWTPIGEVRHGGRTLRFVLGDLEPTSDYTIAYLTDGGVDDASGEWTIAIDELVGGGAGHLKGPWVLRFDAP